MKNLDINKPLIEQIYDELFVNIETFEEFDRERVKMLRQLTINGELKKYAKTIGAIKETLAKKDETA